MDSNALRFTIYLGNDELAANTDGGLVRMGSGSNRKSVRYGDDSPVITCEVWYAFY